MFDSLFHIIIYLCLIASLVPALLFIIEIVKYCIYDFPTKRINELEKQVVIIEEAFKVKYKTECEEHSYLFDDEEWYITKTKQISKDIFSQGDIHCCIHVNTNYYIEQLKITRNKCQTKVICFFSEFINDVENRRLNAIKKANNIEELYKITQKLTH